MDAKLWFIQLSGWSVFLAVVAVIGCGLLGLLAVLTRL